ncbi:MAG: SpoIIIAH-like family protein [Clostridia bacterium]|nr:SpoIIIAH-like family protein [Clostridia bacterium]
MKLGKKQIVIFSLLLVMGVAIYLNMTFDNNITLQNKDKILGEATLVNTGVSTEETEEIKTTSYFDEAKITRQKNRDEAVELLNDIIDNEKVDSQTKEKAVIDITNIANTVEKEGKIENLLKAKGFSECVALCSSDGVSVMVASDGLEPKEVSQIKDIVLSETNVSSSNIKIIEVN